MSARFEAGERVRSWAVYSARSSAEVVADAGGAEGRDMLTEHYSSSIKDTIVGRDSLLLQFRNEGCAWGFWVGEASLSDLFTFDGTAE
jgi:hypothetical protein